MNTNTLPEEAKKLSARQIKILRGEAPEIPYDRLLMMVHVWTRDGFMIPDELMPPVEDLDRFETPARPQPKREQPMLPITEAEAFERFPCIYRTPTTDVIECRPCHGSRVHTVCECALFNRKCTVRSASANGIRTCLACDARKADVAAESADGKFSWAVGVTTAPRKGSTLGACLHSMVENGWNPIVFAEPGTDVTVAEKLGLRIVQRQERLGCWYNWLEASRQLLAEFPNVDAIMTVQDDTVFHPEAKGFVEAHGLWPTEVKKVGFFSFYSAKHYQYRYRVQREDGTVVGEYPHMGTADHYVQKAVEKKWPKRLRVDLPLPNGPHRIATKGFWGACALAFPPANLAKIVNHRIALEWRGFNGNAAGANVKNSDTAIGKICNNLSLGMWIWNPSLAQHVARHSTLGHGGNRGRRSAHRMTKDPWSDAEPRQKMGWLSMQDLDSICARFASKLPRDIRAVAGVPRSGVLAANMIANHLHVPLIPIEACFENPATPYRPRKSRPLREVEGKVLIVDDAVSSGRTFRELQPLLKVDHYLVAPISTVRGQTHVEQYEYLCATPQVFQWNWLSVNYTERFLFDMDGVICEDWKGGNWKKERAAYENFLADAKPLYIPRRKIIAVVTGRSELVRGQTAEWLDRHGVQYGELVMRDDDDKRDHAEFKAEAYQGFGAAHCFAESSDHQAKIIADRTGRSVLSIEVWKMYNEWRALD